MKDVMESVSFPAGVSEALREMARERGTTVQDLVLSYVRDVLASTGDPRLQALPAPGDAQDKARADGEALDPADLLALATRFTVLERRRSGPLASLWEITVELRQRLDDGTTLWAVSNGGSVLARDRQWVYEPMPSNRTEEFIRDTRWTLEEAVAAAREEITKFETLGHMGYWTAKDTEAGMLAGNGGGNG